MYEIRVDQEKCIRCMNCVKVCPAYIFVLEKTDKTVRAVHPENCIGCGHCSAACPTDAVVHSLFPPEKVHAVDREKLPTPEQVMELILSRRTNRAFSKKPVPAELLDRILEAAHRAPTASNMQNVEFTLITDPEKLKSVSQFTLDTFGELAKRLRNPLLKPVLKKIVPSVYRYLPAFDLMREKFRNGDDQILRNATALILFHTPKENRFGCQDANLAYQNGSLMAESLGVSQVYTGFLCTAIRQNKNKLEKMLGIDGRIHAGMGLGIPQFTYPKYIDRKEIVVKKI